MADGGGWIGAGDPAVSVVIIAHSVRHELETCLASIDEHAGMAVEVIVVDQASTDDTRAWLGEHYPSVKVIELEENEGLAAREHGLQRASGRYTMFIDTDARLTEGALPTMAAALDEHPAWGLVGPHLVYEDGSDQPSARRTPHPLLPVLRRPPLNRWFEDSTIVRRYLMDDFALDRTRPVFHVLGACQLFRTALARKAGRFAPWAWGPDDADWCIRIRDAGGEVVYLRDATVVHGYRRASSQKLVSRAALWHLVGFYRFQWKYLRRRREFARLERELDQRAAA